MKTFYIAAAIFCSAIFTSPVSAQSTVTKESIKVWGNCGMCKKTIEKSAKAAGASTADWNPETQVLAVAYKPSKTSSSQIQKAIAGAGYDTEGVTANDAAYDNLHGCCKYDRKATAAETSDVKACCDNSTCGKEGSTCKDMAGCKDKSCCKM
ncbi:MAG: hypothetical protein Q7T76_03395 [Ferruginibacter sp.]|nr:hypothetical protein [Ferruginibacter sp.]